MGLVTFETDGGLLKVQVAHLVAIYDELGVVKISTTAGGVHTLSKRMTVQKAAQIVVEADEA